MLRSSRLPTIVDRKRRKNRGFVCKVGDVRGEKRMIVTLALVVILSSIAAFFAQEIGDVIKKVLAVPGLN